MLELKPKLFSRYAAERFSRIADAVIQEFQGNPKELRKSSAGQGLISHWEEYCDQVQHGFYFNYEMYQNVLSGIIERHLNALDETLVRMLWLETERFWDWDEEEEPSREDCLQALEEHVESIVFQRADDYELEGDPEDVREDELAEAGEAVHG